ncbi:MULTISPECIES: hypothetical protein [Xanthobacter]|nr:hypothetical protein [Xanthobacter autotrophicus]
MDRSTANALIERIWTIEEQIKSALQSLAVIERTIAGEVEDDE